MVIESSNAIMTNNINTNTRHSVFGVAVASSCAALAAAVLDDNFASASFLSAAIAASRASSASLSASFAATARAVSARSASSAAVLA